MLAGVPTGVGAGAKNKIQRFGAILKMDQLVREVVTLELTYCQLRVVRAVLDQQNFGVVFSTHGMIICLVFPARQGVG